MTLDISYSEILDFICDRFHIRPELTMIDDKTIRVLYNRGFLMPGIKVNVRVEEVVDEGVRLSYHCKPPIAFLIQGAVALIQNRIPSNIMQIDTHEKTVQLNLGEIEQLKAAFDYMRLEDLRFGSAEMNLTIASK
jgi:hypothetical protein